jgi:signal transduction histidine kinase
MLIVPMLREGHPIGAIAVYRQEVEPFSEQQIALVATFADQGVIAIENVRLFNELQERNRALTAALEQQTATAEILRVISSSPTDLAPVFDAILESATRLCGAHVGLLGLIQDGHYRPMADRGTTPEFRQWWYEPRSRFPDPRTGVGRMLHERRPIHIPDLTAEPLYRERDAVRVATVELAGARTFLAVPMLKEGRVVGGIVIYRPEVRPFTDQQIALVQTFANQAVIAIENVRLFNELQARTQELTRSVEQLTALGDVGQAISSTLDLETVLTTIVSHAVQLTASDGGTIFEYDESTEQFHQRATERLSVLLETEAQRRDVGDLFRPWADALRSPLRIKKGEGVVGRLPEARRPIQVSDIAAVGAYEGPLRDALLESGIRAVLTVPLLREDRLVGALTVNRRTAGAFSPEVVALLTTFAAQSAIAIQNARLFRELEAKGRELEEASRHKSRFLANMSHELRTPMNAILGYTELIADGIYGDVPDRMREIVERVGASGRHLLGLINDVLDLSKIEAGQLTLALADYSMKEVVEAVVAAVEGLTAEKRLQLIVDLAPALPTGRGDQRRLAQVLLNLVGNAIKFTEQGHVAIRVGVAADLFTVAVSDTGAGIAPADQERIFEEFQQADTSTTRPKGGTGLGLAIARQIVSMHGGRLWVESVLGEGATFRFTMPVRVEQPVVVRAGAP